MCGIAGKYSFNDSLSKEANFHLINNILEKLHHRGPDDKSIWQSEDEKITLGHKRLSILDLSIKGRQPMVSSSKRYVCAFNGEIYNFLELREKLIHKGVRFKSNSDTEVLLEMVDIFGLEKTLDQIDGMFAFAIWDCSKKEIYLCRDRAGKKPLYFCSNQNSVIFSSEIKGLKVTRKKSFSIDDEASLNFFALGYIPGFSTIYKEIKEVRPGHYLKISSGKISEHLYWNLNSIEDLPDITFKEAVDKTEEILKRSIKKRLNSDVPLGFFLSGGIDSGLIVAIASQMERDISTYTISFDDKDFDESLFSKKVSDKYNTNHVVLKSSIDPLSSIFDVAKNYDQPFGDPSAIPSLAICKEASKKVKVVLCGDGGDELFGGYRRSQAANLANKHPFLFSKKYSILINLLSLLSNGNSNYRSNFLKAERLLRGSGKNVLDMYLLWAANGFSLDSFKIKDEIFLKKNLSLSLLKNIPFFESKDIFNQFSNIDFLSQLPSSLLPKMDIASMSSSLEARSPFLDKELIEFSFSVPRKVKMKGNTSKPILRALGQKYLPKDIYKGSKKGFEIPLNKWLKGPLREILNDLADNRNSILFEIFDYSFIQDLLVNKKNIHTHSWANRTWLILMFLIWEQESYDL